MMDEPAIPLSRGAVLFDKLEADHGIALAGRNAVVFRILYHDVHIGLPLLRTVIGISHCTMIQAGHCDPAIPQLRQSSPSQSHSLGWPDWAIVT